MHKIRLLGDPILRQPCADVVDFAGEETVAAIEELREALSEFRAENGFGRGISAPQVGRSLRIIVLCLSGNWRVVCNPVITRKSEETFEMWDDCFSFPWLMVKVRRHDSICIEYRDENNCSQQWVIEDRGTSELLQHEMDHLDGVLSVDRAKSVSDIVARNVWLLHKDDWFATDYEIAPMK